MDETNMPKSAYVGLRNQDSSCYLNSVLQCLFFTRELREAILSCSNAGDSHIMYHLQKLCQKMTGNSSPNTEEIIQYLRMNNVHQLEVVECFQLLMNKIIENTEEFRQPYQGEIVQSTTCHGGSYLMRLEKPVLNLTFSIHKRAPPLTAYCVHSCLETVPQILVIHLKRDPRDVNVEVSEPPSVTLKTEKQLGLSTLLHGVDLKYHNFSYVNSVAEVDVLRSTYRGVFTSDTDYELFAVCRRSGGIQGNQYMAKIKSVENDCWYHFTDTQVREIPEGQICLDEQHSATTSLLMYYRVNSDARPIIDRPAGPSTESMENSVIGDASSQGYNRWNSDVRGHGECGYGSGLPTSRRAPSSDSQKVIDRPAGPSAESMENSVIGDASSQGYNRWNSDVRGHGECGYGSGLPTSRRAPSSDSQKVIDRPAGPSTESMENSVIGDASSQGYNRWNSDVRGHGECGYGSGLPTSRRAPSSDSQKVIDRPAGPSTESMENSVIGDASSQGYNRWNSDVRGHGECGYGSGLPTSRRAPSSDSQKVIDRPAGPSTESMENSVIGDASSQGYNRWNSDVRGHGECGYGSGLPTSRRAPSSDSQKVIDRPAGPSTESMENSVIGDASSQGYNRWNSDVRGHGECGYGSGLPTSRRAPSSDSQKVIDRPAGPSTESMENSVIGDASSQGYNRWNSDVRGHGECGYGSGLPTSRRAPSSDSQKVIDRPAGPSTESMENSVIGDASSQGYNRWNSDVRGHGECGYGSGLPTSRRAPSSDSQKVIDRPAGPSTESMENSVIGDASSQGYNRWNSDVRGHGECGYGSGLPTSRRAPSSDSQKGAYVGLHNQGSTCYLNSVLQCLFFTRELREAILSCANGGDSGIVCQLKKLFEELKCNKSAPSTKGITKCLGVIDVHQQQDVAEYFRILMTKIVEDKEGIRQLYQVEMVHSITCHGCERQTRIEENPVLSLALSLNKCNLEAYSVHKALDAVQKENTFTGDDQFYCETCGSKQDATSRFYFETLPQILVLNLKRYQFDGNRFTKLHYEVSVPFSLTVNLKEQTVENMDFQLSSQVRQYELFAMCHHSGGIDGGHYVAEIKSYENKCWYEFNDTTVYKVSEEWNTMDAKNSSTAYLLMYRMVNSFAKPRMHVALRNQSCTCYLNSVLHCLFFTRELRKAILRCDNVDNSIIVRHLQQLFKKLMTGTSSPTTEKITRALEIGNVHQQLNVKECFQLLMNKIIEDKEEIQQLYQMKMVHLITCQGCSHQKMLKESNLSICLSVQKQNSDCTLYSVDRALADMQEEHPYPGDGQHSCQRHGNQRSTQRYCFETLPQILVIHLERDLGDINAGVSVPLSLKLTTGKQLETDYELFGICHRIGAIHGDHYTAEVKSVEDNHWYHFSDGGVFEVSEEQISSKVQNSDPVSLLMYHKVNSNAKPEAKKIEKNTGRRNPDKIQACRRRLSPVKGGAARMRAANPQQKPGSKKKKKHK
ncbi:uncharacterized protein RBU57_008990 [Macrochelys suwanniensis]